VDTLKNLKSKMCLTLFWLLHDYLLHVNFIVFMSSLLFYNMQNIKNNEKSWNE
jgi:hypothetical protein